MIDQNFQLQHAGGRDWTDFPDHYQLRVMYEEEWVVLAKCLSERHLKIKKH